MRVFVALPVEGRIADELSLWTQKERQSHPFRKWTHPLDYHITLQFLGEWPESRLEELDAALRGVAAEPMTLTLNGGGTFGPRAAPRVLWAGAAGDLERLNALYMAIVQSTQPLGFEAEDRPFAPHITLARGFAGGDGNWRSEVIASMPSVHSWLADRFVLMRTRMGASPMYETIGEYALVYS
ncbi:RNA 2',3'-cyclic phosphodiesterase [Paenibacillus sp. LHD-117]|uniref:RNA 2',3'-cyclic phosphodiesterase n=1 Tax=Paenibacillus sp. LHD-117 TaxID=3071412 RepID=UPI0027E1E95E|nr:RNA 2',3'-cyclic phosphodiesterase [Paenibacillus sp. LHD-117]MDQ6419094.1 RNA 2',3'-cyclic phosphodiesterase [Paenibacillus sp. LHD-117]